MEVATDFFLCNVMYTQMKQIYLKEKKEGFLIN